LPYGGERLTLIIGTSLFVERDHLIDGRVWLGSSKFTVQARARIGPQSEVKQKQMVGKPTFGIGLPLLGVLLPWLAPARNSRV
jgi:hypothetical protein